MADGIEKQLLGLLKSDSSGFSGLTSSKVGKNAANAAGSDEFSKILNRQRSVPGSAADAAAAGKPVPPPRQGSAAYTDAAGGAGPATPGGAAAGAGGTGGIGGTNNTNTPTSNAGNQNGANAPAAAGDTPTVGDAEAEAEAAAREAVAKSGGAGIGADSASGEADGSGRGVASRDVAADVASATRAAPAAIDLAGRSEARFSLAVTGEASLGPGARVDLSATGAALPAGAAAGGTVAGDRSAALRSGPVATDLTAAGAQRELLAGASARPAQARAATQGSIQGSLPATDSGAQAEGEGETLAGRLRTAADTGTTRSPAQAGLENVRVAADAGATRSSAAQAGAENARSAGAATDAQSSTRFASPDEVIRSAAQETAAARRGQGGSVAREGGGAVRADRTDGTGEAFARANDAEARLAQARTQAQGAAAQASNSPGLDRQAQTAPTARAAAGLRTLAAGEAPTTERAAALSSAEAEALRAGTGRSGDARASGVDAGVRADQGPTNRTANDMLSASVERDMELPGPRAARDGAATPATDTSLSMLRGDARAAEPPPAPSQPAAVTTAPASSLNAPSAQNPATAGDPTRMPEMSLERAPNDPEFASEVTARMKVLVRDGVREARIQLHPAELGRLQVTVNTDGDQARVSFVAETSAARDAIEQSLPRLRDTLEQAGLQLAQSDVGQQGQAQARSEGTASASGFADGDGSERDEAAEEVASRDGSSSSSSRIDTYI
ncbi:MAG: flagellar hook-length control protein FliK [Halieaceae bacterium]|jgi:flagellar hook-length control protein FliK|nr:flagellar hook-length control protein FliK [Halieaceae bacterium]